MFYTHYLDAWAGGDQGHCRKKIVLVQFSSEWEILGEQAQVQRTQCISTYSVNTHVSYTQNLSTYTSGECDQIAFALSLGSLCNRTIVLASKEPTVKSF